MKLSSIDIIHNLRESARIARLDQKSFAEAMENQHRRFGVKFDGRYLSDDEADAIVSIYDAACSRAIREAQEEIERLGVEIDE